MNRKKSDVVTIDEVSWDFATPDVLDQLRSLADGFARSNEYIDPDDLVQEMCLYLAARPQQTGSISHLMQAARFCARDYAKQKRIETEREVLTLDADWSSEDADS